MQTTHLDHGVLVSECEIVQNDQCREFTFLFSALKAHIQLFCQRNLIIPLCCTPANFNLFESEPSPSTPHHYISMFSLL